MRERCGGCPAMGLPDDVQREQKLARVRAGPGLRVHEQINPGAVARDQRYESFSLEQLREMAELGLVGFTAPTEIGGQGRDWEAWGHVLEEVGYHCTDSGLPMLSRG